MKLRKLKILSFIFLCILFVQLSFEAIGQKQLPSDKKATAATVNLFINLKKVHEKGFLVGHQDALAYGTHWKYKPGRSDVKDVAGDYPAVYGWDLGHLETGASLNLDSVPFDKMKDYIRQGYARCGVNTLSWHGTNPLTGKSSWDPAPGTVAAILPGGEKHALFKAQLDKLAEFMADLKGKNGEYIPILFRPFHEHTGGWFWWGNSAASDDEYKQLFRFTVNYLRDIKQLHHLLYVYNTGSEFNTAEEYLERYPGDDVVDVLSFDTYQAEKPDSDEHFIETVDFHLSIIDQLAKEKDKVSVLAETGYQQVPNAQWWTETLLKAMEGKQAAYVLMWRNAGYKPQDNTTEFYMPYKGHASAKDFIRFYQHPATLFNKDAARLKLYH